MVPVDLRIGQGKEEHEEKKDAEQEECAENSPESTSNLELFLTFVKRFCLIVSPSPSSFAYL